MAPRARVRLGARIRAAMRISSERARGKPTGPKVLRQGGHRAEPSQPPQRQAPSEAQLRVPKAPRSVHTESPRMLQATRRGHLSPSRVKISHSM